MKCFHPKIVQHLKPTDITKRLEFARTILAKINESPNFMNLILFSDEAVFHLDGGVNIHNASHWSVNNPHWLIEKSLNSPKTMVWAAIGDAGVIGPFFFDGNVNGISYLKMMKEKFFPEFCRLPNAPELLFMQDGAPPHWQKDVRSWLNEKFPGRWIGRGGAEDLNITWPPRSPDLTPADFFLWGFVKGLVYKQNYENLDQLKAAIVTAFQQVSQEMLFATMENFVKRLNLVLECNGGHIEM